MNFYRPDDVIHFVKHKDCYGYFRYSQIPTKYFENWLATILNNTISLNRDTLFHKIISQMYPGISRNEMFVKVAMDKKSNNWKYK